MHTILVATDLSERSDRAMSRAAALANQFKAKLHIAHIVDEDLPTAIAGMLVSQARVSLETLTKDSPTFKGIELEIHVEFGDPWRSILSLSDHLKADILIVGTHRSRGLKDLFVGTTAERMIKATTKPILVVKQPVAGDYDSPVVGIDFSDCARNAVRFTAKLVPDAPITLVHAYHIPFKTLTTSSDPAGDIPISERRQYEEAPGKMMDRMIQSLKFDLDKRKINVVIREGGPIDAIQSEGKTRNADLLSIGVHGRSWLADALLGSTARELLTMSARDVLLTPL